MKAELDDARLLDGLAQLQRILARRLPDVPPLAEVLLGALSPCLGVPNACVLLARDGDLLEVVASRGLPALPVGQVVPVGEGPIGVAARERRVIRIVSLQHQLRQMAVMLATVGAPEPTQDSRAGAQSVLAAPMCVRGRLLGVLYAESMHRSAYGRSHEQAFEVAAALLALHLSTQGDSSARGGQPVAPEPDDVPAPLRVRYFEADHSVFFGSDYVIKGVPGRILFAMLEAYATSGRVDFSNKELRLAHGDKLPWAKDNLESRLILLRRRLEEKDLGVRLERAGRGRLQLVVRGPVAVTVEPAPE